MEARLVHATEKVTIGEEKGSDPDYEWSLLKGGKPCKILGFKHRPVDFGENNPIERLFRTLKDRTRRFYHTFTKKVKSTIRQFSLRVESPFSHVRERLKSLA